MEYVVIALCVVLVVLIISLCFLGYYYQEYVADKSTIAMYKAQISADQAAEILAKQAAADALAAQMLADAHQMSDALHNQQTANDANIAQLTAQAKQAAQDAVAAQAAADQAAQSTALTAQAKQAAQDRADALASQAHQAAQDKADAVAAQLSADQTLQATALSAQARQAAQDQAAALLQQKNNLTQQAAHDLADAISQQQTINAKALSDALASAQATAAKSQQDAVAAQKSADVILSVTAATVAVVQQAQATTLAAVSSINTLVIQAITAYQTASLLVSNYAIIVGLARYEYIRLPLNTPYDILSQYSNKAGVIAVGMNYATFPTATFLLNELNANYISQLSAYHDRAARQNAVAAAATLATDATRASQAAQAAQVAATALTASSVASFNSIISVVQNLTNRELGISFSNISDQDSATALMQTVGFGPVMDALNNLISDTGSLMMYGQRIVQIIPNAIPNYILAQSKEPPSPQINYVMQKNGAWVAVYADVTRLAPGAASDGTITDVMAATKEAQRLMNVVYADIQNLTASIITTCNMISAYLSDDMQIFTGIMLGTVAYKYCFSHAQPAGMIPPYSLGLALSLSQGDIQPVSDLPNAPNYVPQMPHVYTAYGNSFIQNTGGVKSLNLTPAITQWIMPAQALMTNISAMLDKCRAMAVMIAANTNTNISIWDLAQKCQGNPVGFLADIPKGIQMYEANKFGIYSQMLGGGFMK